jgi:catechol 2,3-dioxygenase-like lactoylglutathione lyase family enzyme
MQAQIAVMGNRTSRTLTTEDTKHTKKNSRSASRPLFKLAIPILHVSSSAVADEFYCDRLGFRRDFAYLADKTKPDPCYMGLVRDEAWLHVSSFSGDGISGGVVHLLVDDVDGLYQELMGKNVTIDLAPTDQTWGNREMYVRDPDGNGIRFVCQSGG